MIAYLSHPRKNTQLITATFSLPKHQQLQCAPLFPKSKGKLWINGNILSSKEEILLEIAMKNNLLKTKSTNLKCTVQCLLITMNAVKMYKSSFPSRNFPYSLFQPFLPTTTLQHALVWFWSSLNFSCSRLLCELFKSRSYKKEMSLSLIFQHPLIGQGYVHYPEKNAEETWPVQVEFTSKVEHSHLRVF